MLYFHLYLGLMWSIPSSFLTNFCVYLLLSLYV
jgi:hypothetical protein